MWPFGKQKKAKTQQSSFSQVDTTERFGDNEGLGPDDWITTTPLNSLVKDPVSMGLPAPGTDDAEVYQMASRLSMLREAFRNRRDGVYCPICHIANVDNGKLGHPCPKCNRILLNFGWD
jgi:hypothetical protein